jgi:hypothetical protein
MDNEEELRDLLEDPKAHGDIETARNMPDAANAQQSIQGYAAINGLDEDDEIARVAYRLYNERGPEEGDADGDWFRAEEEVRRQRQE